MLQYLRRNIRYARPENWSRAAKVLKRKITRSGILDDPADIGMANMLPAKKLDKLLELFAPATLLDVGCGAAASLKYVRGKGVDALGIEASAAAIRASGASEFIRRHDLRKPLDLHRTFDVVWSFEVAEHLHARHADQFVDALARHGDLVVMSAAPPGQGGEGHLNEQPPSYWIEKFRNRGMALHEEWTEEFRSVPEFYSENMMVFVADGQSA